MNTEKLTKRLEIGAYVAIILMAAVTSIILIPKWAGKYFRQSTTQASAPVLKPGDQITVPNQDWKKNGRTVLLFLSTKCHFCTESAPFYRTLMGQLENKQVHIAAVFPQSVEEGKQYLSSLGVLVTNVQNLPSELSQVRSTPTLVLVDDKGTVIDSWIGKLTPSDESAVISKITAKSN